MRKARTAFEQEIYVVILIDQLNAVECESDDSAYQLSITLNTISRRAFGKTGRLTADQWERPIQSVERASKNHAVLFLNDE